MSLAAELAKREASNDGAKTKPELRVRGRIGERAEDFGGHERGQDRDSRPAALLFRVCAAHVVCARDAALSTGTDWDGVGSPAGRPGGWR